MFEYREGSTVDGSMFTGWGRGEWGNGGWNGGWGDNDRDDDRRGGGNYGQLNIVQATYGTDGRHRADVTGRLRSLIRDGRLDITVDNGTMGTDPAQGRPKTLWVRYTVGGRSQQETRVPEKSRISLP
jgi:hypothetical protein